jgi:hypothetical protein
MVRLRAGAGVGERGDGDDSAAALFFFLPRFEVLFFFLGTPLIIAKERNWRFGTG